MDEVNRLFALRYAVLLLTAFVAVAGWQTLVKPLWFRWQIARFRRILRQARMDFIAPVRPLRLSPQSRSEDSLGMLMNWPGEVREIVGDDCVCFDKFGRLKWPVTDEMRRCPKHSRKKSPSEA